MSDESSISYENPPILEAIIEIRFGEPASEANLKKVSDWLKSRYYNVQIEEQVEVKVDFPTRSAEFKLNGNLYRLSSSDLTTECSVSPFNIAWTSRAPYEGWSSFVTRVTSDLDTASKVLFKRQVVRLGLRYINRIDVPISQSRTFEYETFFNFKVDTQGALEPSTHYHWAVRKEYQDEMLSSLVQSAVMSPELIGQRSFSLDIDIASEVDVPQRVDDILSKLGQMRVLKNRLFEAALTPVAKERFL